MGKMRKNRFIAWLLVFFMAVQTTGFQAAAQEPVREKESSKDSTKESVSRAAEEPEASMTAQNMQVEAEEGDSFGTLLGNTLKDSAETSDNSAGYRVAELEIENQEAVVRYQAEKECDLVVAVYSEDGSQMFGSGTIKAEPGAGTVRVMLSVKEWPEYYLTKAYLLDETGHHALSETFVDERHTKESEDFYAKTIHDPSFEGKEVLNLDDDETNNFAVFAEGTVIEDEAAGNVTVQDNKDGTYTVSNPTEQIKALKDGQAFVYRNKDGSLVIVVVSGTVKDDGDTVTITDNSDASLEDVFEYVKISGESDKMVPVGAAQGNSGDTDSKAEDSEKEVTSLPIDFGTEAEIKGTFSAEGGVEVGIDNGHPTVHAKITGTIKVEGKLSANVSLKTDLGKIAIILPDLPGVMLTFVPGISFSASGSINLNASVTATTGFDYNGGRETPFKDLTTGPEFDGNLDTEIDIYVGLSLTPSIEVLNGKIAKVSLNIEIGCRVNMKSHNGLKNEIYIHECKLCYAGEVHAIGKVNGTVTLLNQKDPFRTNFPDIDYKVCDFYWSVSNNNEHGKGFCPHIKYIVNVKATDENGAAVDSAKVRLQDNSRNVMEEKQTSSGGEVRFELHPGKYMIIFTKDSLLATQSVNISKDKELENHKHDHTVVMEDKGCGENLYWSLDDGGTLSIIGTGPMFDWTSGNEIPWAKDRQKIKALYISEGVTYLGDFAFYDCAGGSNELKLPETLTAIGNYTFASRGFWYSKGFTFIGELAIPENVTSIGKMCFERSGCSENEGEENVTKVTFGNHLKEIGEGAFQGFRCECEIVLPDSLENIPKDAFWGSTLTGITLGKDVKLIGENAFGNCSYLTGDLIIPDHVVTIEKKAFNDCTALNGSLTIGKSVEMIGECAFGAEGQLSLWKGDPFTGELVIPDSVKIIGNAAFRDCSNLTSLTLGKGVQEIRDGAFSNCTSLKNNLVIPDSVEIIGEQAFLQCDFNGLVLGKGLRSIGAGAFTDCKNMKAELEFPEGLEILGGFGGCSSLTGSVSVPDTVTEIETSAFEGCTGLDGSLSLSAQLKKIGKAAFSGCSGLKGKLDIPSTVNLIGQNAFEGCSGFTGDLNLPNGLTAVNYEAFSDCSGFTGELVIPSSVTTISNAAFMGCTGLTSLTLNGSLKTLSVRAFNNCTGLAQITFLGNAPQTYAEAFSGVTANAYYLDGNATWEERVMQALGENLTWQPIKVSAVNAVSDILQENGERKITDTQEDEVSYNEENEEDTPYRTSEELQNKEEQKQSMVKAVGGTAEIEEGKLTAEFENLVPNSTYVVLAVKKEDAENLVDSENLLYISQEKADESGGISITCTPVEISGLMSIKVYGKTDWDLKNSEVLLGKSSYTYTGEAFRPTVKVEYNGKYLTLNKDYTVVYENNVNAGTAKAVVTGAGNYQGSQTKEFTIEKADQTIECAFSSKNIKVGETVSIGAAAPGKLTFTSSDPDIATVTGQGAVTGKKAGTVRITVKAEETENYNGRTRTVSFNVLNSTSGSSGGNPSKDPGKNPSKDPGQNLPGNSQTGRQVQVNSISLSGISKKIAAGKKFTLKAKVLPDTADNKSLSWSSSNKKYASVDSKGIVATTKAGKGKSVTITARANDGSGKTGKFKIKIMKGAVKKVRLTAPKSVKAGRKVTVRAKVTATKGANKKLKYTVSSKKYAFVNSKGIVTTKKAGKGKNITVIAKATDGSNKKASVKIKLKK